MEKKGISHTCKIEVRYSETDAMGVVHHGSYPIWFEQARIDFFKAIGAPYTEIEKEGFESPVLELVVKYRKACRLASTTPVAGYSFFSWRAITALWVPPPNTPSAVPERKPSSMSASCRAVTWLPEAAECHKCFIYAGTSDQHCQPDASCKKEHIYT